MNTPISQLNKHINTSIHFIYTNLLSPKSVNEDEKRREFILNVILLGSIILLFWSNIYIYLDILNKGIEHHGISLILFSLFTLFFVFLYVLSRIGFITLSSYLLITLYFLGSLYSAYHWGPDLPASLLGFALVIAVSSILISTRFSLVVGIIISISITSLGYLEIEHHILPYLHWKREIFDIGDAIEYSLILFVIMIVSWLSNREIEKSLDRARKSEADLKVERDQLEIKVEERTKELKQMQVEKMSQLYRFAEFGKLSSGIFHDLINPLNALSLNIHKIQSATTDNGLQIEPYLSKAISASKRMENFILAVRKQIQTQDCFSTFSLNSEIEEAVSILEHKSRKNNVSIQFVCNQKIYTYGNPLKFHQIISNLLSNAIDSYDEKTTRQSHEWITLSLTSEHNLVQIKIHDDGAGISDDIKEKIFDPFFTTKQPGKGTGLGLSTTKHIIEKDFNGSIKIISDNGVGTTFTVEFPLIINPHNESHPSIN